MEHKSCKYNNQEEKKNNNKTYFDLATKRVGIEVTNRQRQNSEHVDGASKKLIEKHGVQLHRFQGLGCITKHEQNLKITRNRYSVTVNDLKEARINNGSQDDKWDELVILQLRGNMVRTESK